MLCKPNIVDSMRIVSLWAVVAIGTQGCATGGAGKGRAGAADRESVADKLSALPGADKESDPENQERRFGVNASKERRNENARQRDHEAQSKGADLVEKP